MNTISEITKAQKVRHLPGDQGVWFFIAADSFLFALFFSSYIFDRAKSVELFTRSQSVVNPTMGVVNTLLLLTGSWFVVLGVAAAKRRARGMVLKCLSLALACGAGFGCLKIFEYHEKISRGITLVTNSYFMYYFVLTGVHFVHLCAGMIVLFALLVKAKNNFEAPRYVYWLESGASFWHMVDLLWIVLFPLLYLVR